MTNKIKDKKIDYDMWADVCSPVFEKGYPSYEAVNNVPVVQLDRTSVYETEGSWFESMQAHHKE